MSYNISPSFNYSGITSSQGWLGGGYSTYGSYTSNGWHDAFVTLQDPGIYLATFSVQFSNSPNAFIYITTSYASSTANVPAYNTGLNYNVGNMGTYVNTSNFTGGTISSFYSGVYDSYQVLAGALQLNSSSGSSAALTILAPVYNPSNNGATLGFFYNSDTNNAIVTYSVNVIRIG